MNYIAGKPTWAEAPYCDKFTLILLFLIGLSESVAHGSLKRMKQLRPQQLSKTSAKTSNKTVPCDGECQASIVTDI